MDITRYYKREGELPLDNICDDGGFAAIFRRIACIGDSLSSGEFELVDLDGAHRYYDIYEHSWGQYIARMTGSVVYNFSRGGMRADAYLAGFADEHGFWDSEYKADAYIIALGVNDVINQKMPIGSIDDANPQEPEKNKNTFIGNYARIISRYKTISPHAKFFLITIPNADPRVNPKCLPEVLKSFADALGELAAKFDNTYLIDLYRYGPVYDKVFRDNFFLSGHMNPQGYLLTAKMICSYIDYIIRQNPKDFELVGLSGRGDV